MHFKSFPGDVVPTGLKTKNKNNLKPSDALLEDK